MMRLNRHGIITILGLLLFCVLIFLPPVIHGYVYPNIGDDSAVHLKALDLMRVGDMTKVGYLGIMLVGFPLLWISNLTNIGIDSLYLWFNYVALSLVGITLYFVMSRLVNKQTGWLALVLTLFCTQGILFQFYFGQTFNLINVGIILPWLVFFTAKYLAGKKVYQLVLIVIFAGLFGTFHTSGVYLPFIAGLVVVVYVIYCRVKKRSMRLHGVILGSSIVVFSVIVAVLLDPFALMGREGIMAVIASVCNPMAKGMAVPVADYMLGIVSPTVLGMLVFACVFHKDIFKNIQGETKILFLILLCTATLLIIVTFIRISFDPWRTALDLATILALLASVSVGLFKRQWNKPVVIVLVLLVCWGLYHNVPTWFGYNSAIRPADKQAIAYANTLGYESYTCSAEVAPWIYSRFMEAEYIKDGSDLLIARSKPMTPRSDVDNIYYEWHGVLPDDSFGLVKIFRDSQIEVYVYERKDEKAN